MRMGNLFAWLFTDPATEGANAGLSGPTPMNFTPWLILAGLALLIPIYYSLEGRRKIPGLKDHGVWKYILDRMTNQLWPWALVGAAVLFFRWAFTSSFFAWRIWHVAWIGWLIGLVVYWIYYFVRVYPGHMLAYQKRAEHSKYLPSSKRRAAGVRR
jgi:hypothetical protein